MKEQKMKRKNSQKKFIKKRFKNFLRKFCFINFIFQKSTNIPRKKFR